MCEPCIFKVHSWCYLYSQCTNENVAIWFSKVLCLVCPLHFIIPSSNDRFPCCFQVSVTMAKLPWSSPYLLMALCKNLFVMYIFGSRIYSWICIDLIWLGCISLLSKREKTVLFSLSWVWKSQVSYIFSPVLALTSWIVSFWWV